MDSHTQVVRLGMGGGKNTPLVDENNPLPVSIQGGGGATAAEISDALTATNANMEASLLSMAADQTKMAATVVGRKIMIGGSSDKWRDSFETLNPKNFDFTTALAAEDRIGLAGDTQGASFAELSLSAFAVKTVSEIKGLRAFVPPYRLGYGASLSQRSNGEMTIISVAAVDETGARIINAGEAETFFGPSLSVKKIVVISNIAYITFDQPHGLKFDDLAVISGAADNRVNIQGRVTGIRSRYTLTMALTITNATYNVGAGCVLNKICVSKGSSDIAGVVLMGATSANAVYFSRGQGSSESLSPDTSFGTGYTDALIPSAQPYSVNLQSRMVTEIVGTMDLQRWIASAIDSNHPGVFAKRSQNVPDPAKSYAMFIDVIALPNRAAPIEILSIVKTGTTTATVTTKNPHGLQTGAYVCGYGSRDQTTLANLTTGTVITVTGENTLTVVWGTAVTKTYYGGMLIPASFGSSSASMNMAITGTAWYNGRLFLGLSTSSGLMMGDVVRLVGVKNTAGIERDGMAGRFRVVAITPNIQESGILVGAGTTISTPTLTMPETGAAPFGGTITGTGITGTINGITANTSLTISANASATGSALQDIALTGVVLEPLDFAAPANDQPLTTISCGAVFRETSLRLNFTRCLDYTRTPVELTGGHYTSDAQQALAIAAPSSLPVSAVQSTAASVGTAGAGAWVVRGAAHTANDIATAALATVGATTSSAIDVQGNTGSMQFNVDATAASGTNPRLITRVQGSFGPGTNFVNLYDIGVVTNATSKNNDSPVIPVEFRYVRYVRDLRGTTPSITHTVNRTMRPLETARRQRRLLDRVVSLLATTASTEWLYVGGCTKAQLMATAIAAQTAAATVKVQLCQGDPTVAGNWYDMPGSPTLTTSTGGAAIAAPFEIGTAKFARLVPTVAGTGIVADTYELSLTAWE